jgi:hypothetical protein
MMAPGPELASVLASIDRSKLSGYDRITLMQARQRLRSHLDAELAMDMVGVMHLESHPRHWPEKSFLRLAHRIGPLKEMLIPNCSSPLSMISSSWRH